jgi:hypothetical protein
MVYERKTPKKIIPVWKCLHCAKEFRINIMWCAMCEDHMAKDRDDWKPGESCTRCESGLNDEWNANREVRKAREAAYALTMKEVEAYWADPNRERSPLIEKHNEWLASKEYKNRFMRGINLGLDMDERQP